MVYGSASGAMRDAGDGFEQFFGVGVFGVVKNFFGLVVFDITHKVIGVTVEKFGLKGMSNRTSCAACQSCL